MDLDYEKFEKSSRYRLGIRSQCMDCRYKIQQNSRLNNFLKTKYGITIEEYVAISSSQNDVCAICHKKETRITRPNAKTYKNGIAPRLAVDHDHESGVIRGLLCHNCNIGIGHFQDNIDLLKSAITYLERLSND